MQLFSIVVLAVVQGLTEFLPVSSKTHLLFAQKLLGYEPDLGLTIVLHAGSLLAILIYYWKAWLDLLRTRRAEILLLAAATVPAVLAYLVLNERLERLYDSPRLGAGLLLVTAGWLVLAERAGRERWSLLEAPAWRPFLMGVAQAFALLPGISRSGSTIGAGYLAGLKRADAVRFSFFLGAIAIAGALAVKAKSAIRTKVPVDPLTIGIGVAVTFVVSLAAIKVVEKLSAKNRFSWFALYCGLAGVVGLIVF